MASPTPAFCRSVAYRALADALPLASTSQGLFRAAWAISLHELPTADVLVGEATVDSLAAAVLSRVRSQQPEALLAHLHDILFDVAGFAGCVEDYYAPANSYLPEVLRTRRGLPISLALIYRTVGTKVGLRVHGVNAPGHFLAEVETLGSDAARSCYVDPFAAGRVLTLDEALTLVAEATGHELEPQPAMLTRATSRDWLERILRNLHAVFAAAGRERDVLAMQELQELVARWSG